MSLRPMSLRSVLLVLPLLVGGCKVLDTADGENSRGRGATAFDPYSPESGARRLILQQFKGCALNVSSTPVSPGTATIPYPALCSDINHFPYPGAEEFPQIVPEGKFYVQTGVKYFLNQLTLMDQMIKVPVDPAEVDATFNDLAGPAEWMKTQSQFASLDWTNLSFGRERWIPDYEYGIWHKEVQFTGAAWMRDLTSTFKLELLDGAGNPRGEMVYPRNEFLAENRQSGHTNVSFRGEYLPPPRFAGDTEAGPYFESFGPSAFRTTVKVEVFGSTNPFEDRQIEIPTDLSGDGAIRVTWSAMPEQPFYFPVTYVAQEDLPPTCFPSDGGDTQVPCGPGLDPQAEFQRPANGKYYEPGEVFNMRIQMKDGTGNLLHSKDHFPSYLDLLMDTNNGLTQYVFGRDTTLMEFDNEIVWQIAGPLQDLGHYEQITTQPPPYTLFPPRLAAGTGIGQLIPVASSFFTVPAVYAIPWSTRQPVMLPADAKPGTYAIYIKATRQWLGERVSKGNAFFFQVGTEEKTNYPGRVGNCQICHRGVISLENLRHGFSVNDVEGCKACHKSSFGNNSRDLHTIHMDSPKYPMPKNQCTVCHLTRESALEPTLDVCSSCHPSVHGDEFFPIRHQLFGTPNRFTSCAESCHKNTPPTSHVLPEN